MWKLVWSLLVQLIVRAMQRVLLVCAVPQRAQDWPLGSPLAAVLFYTDYILYSDSTQYCAVINSTHSIALHITYTHATTHNRVQYSTVQYNATDAIRSLRWCLAHHTRAQTVQHTQHKTNTSQDIQRNNIQDSTSYRPVLHSNHNNTSPNR